MASSCMLIGEYSGYKVRIFPPKNIRTSRSSVISVKHYVAKIYVIVNTYRSYVANTINLANASPYHLAIMYNNNIY